jgi:hypothetical protein
MIAGAVAIRQMCGSALDTPGWQSGFSSSGVGAKHSRPPVTSETIRVRMPVLPRRMCGLHPERLSNTSIMLGLLNPIDARCSMLGELQS